MISDAKIIGITQDDAGFSVSFPNGFDCEPDIQINGLSIDRCGDSFIYGALAACSNFINDHVKKMKDQPQVEFEVDTLSNENGVVDFSINKGIINNRLGKS